jgi:hypothetical protein
MPAGENVVFAVVKVAGASTKRVWALAWLWRHS